ncbi:hypothetical protein SAMN05660703_0423 [Cellulophaga tyrosinoxydans]|uniref:Uncharacterized protein n=1 Tax=Cellulophaga tyrosinoxydans TaxID=504486 RepID=A0A1W1YG12_9FLAO|nr:hypothetical protein SAMN05660703_0423 [Cellulophaga tyrosinoxydans]
MLYIVEVGVLGILTFLFAINLKAEIYEITLHKYFSHCKRLKKQTFSIL